MHQKRDMHILILPSWYPKFPGDIGGSFFREQAIALTKHGCQVGVVAVQLRSLKQYKTVFSGSFKVDFEDDQGVATYRQHGVNWFPRLHKLQAKLWGHYGCKLVERYIAEHGRPDLIHVHSMLNAGIVARHIKQRYGIPYVVTEHSSTYLRKLLSPYQIQAASEVANCAQRRFAVSTPFADLISECLVGIESAWEVMPNIVHDSFFSHPLRLVKQQGFVFSHVSLLAYHKRVDLLIQAFAIEFKGNKEVRLHVGGAGEERQALERLTTNLGLSDQVCFLGKLTREQVVHEVAAADAFVLSSQHETFGVVLIEALALGKPVIATRCGGPEDIVTGKNGLLVPVDDVKALAGAMQVLYANRANYQAECLRQSCRERFSEAAISQRLLGVYAEVLSSSKPDSEILGSA